MQHLNICSDHVSIPMPFLRIRDGAKITVQPSQGRGPAVFGALCPLPRRPGCTAPIDPFPPLLGGRNPVHQKMHVYQRDGLGDFGYLMDVNRTIAEGYHDPRRRGTNRIFLPSYIGISILHNTLKLTQLCSVRDCETWPLFRLNEPHVHTTRV